MNKLWQQQQFPLQGREQGTAIIVALFLVAVVAAIAINMMARLNRDIQRTELLMNSTQANLYAQGSVAWAMDTLINNWLNQKKNMVIDRLPLSSPPNTVNHFQISSTIYDAQAALNLNNLSAEPWTSNFQRLLLLLNPQLGNENAQKITKSVVNWISSSSSNPDDDQYYLKLAQPYRVSHRLMASVSEFRLIKGVTPQLYSRLLPYITALPENTLINVNTAPGPVLQSLSPQLSAESVKIIDAIRKQTPFSSNEQFTNLDPVRNSAVPDGRITVSSQYFLIKTQVNKNDQHLLLYTLVQRLAQDKKVSIQVLWQSKGGI